MRVGSGGPRSARAAGYSETPLAKKLGIKPGAQVCTIRSPPDYARWLEPLPADTVVSARLRGETCDIVHLFAHSLAQLECDLPKARRMVAANGAIWVSWHKKSSGMASDVTGDVIRAQALRTDLVDVKVCAVTDVWSGLKLVVRKHLR